MSERPKIRMRLSATDKALEGAATIAIVVLWILAIYAYIHLPGSIPVHFDASGQVTRYGDKTTLVLLPVLATFLFACLTMLNRHPDKLNYAIKITEANARQQYTYATRMLRFLKVAVAVVFLLIILFTYLTTVGKSNGLGKWFLPIVIATMCVPTIFFVFKSLRAK